MVIRLNKYEKIAALPPPKYLLPIAVGDLDFHIVVYHRCTISQRGERLAIGYVLDEKSIEGLNTVVINNLPTWLK